MLAKLPSGATAELEVPGLPSLLAAGGDLMPIAACSFVHDEVTVDELSESDVLFIAAWALEGFAATEDALELAIVSETLGGSPSQRLGVSDRALAWELDRALYLRFAKASKDGAPVPEDDNSDRILFTSEGGEP